MTEAGLRGMSALTATRGWGSPMRCTQTLTADSGTLNARATCATGAGSGVDATAEREQRTVMVAPTMSARLIDKAHGREVKTAHPWVEADARSSPT